MKTEKHTRFNIYKPMQKNIPSITRYIMYQLQIKGNNGKKNYTNKWTNISNIYDRELFSKFAPVPTTWCKY
jgi:hypothetical protein